MWCLPARRAAAGWEARLKMNSAFKRSLISNQRQPFTLNGSHGWEKTERKA
jgi:hypothetical protein